MKENGHLSEYTIRHIIDEMDVIECCETQGSALVAGEVLKNQDIFMGNWE